MSSPTETKAPSLDKEGWVNGEISNLSMEKSSTTILASDSHVNTNDDPAKKRYKQMRETRNTMGCWNITFLNNKIQELITELQNHKIDLCAVSETKSSGKKEYKP